MMAGAVLQEIGADATRERPRRGRRGPASRDAVEHVLVGEDALRLSGREPFEDRTVTVRVHPNAHRSDRRPRTVPASCATLRSRFGTVVTQLPHALPTRTLCARKLTGTIAR